MFGVVLLCPESQATGRRRATSTRSTGVRPYSTGCQRSSIATAVGDLRGSVSSSRTTGRVALDAASDRDFSFAATSPKSSSRLLTAQLATEEKSGRTSGDCPCFGHAGSAGSSAFGLWVAAERLVQRVLRSHAARPFESYSTWRATAVPSPYPRCALRSLAKVPRSYSQIGLYSLAAGRTA